MPGLVDQPGQQGHERGQAERKPAPERRPQAPPGQRHHPAAPQTRPASGHASTGGNDAYRASPPAMEISSAQRVLKLAKLPGRPVRASAPGRDSIFPARRRGARSRRLPVAPPSRQGGPVGTRGVQTPTRPFGSRGVRSPQWQDRSQRQPNERGWLPRGYEWPVSR